jgi:hypothetical protein
MKIAKFGYEKNMKIKEFKHPYIMVATYLAALEIFMKA